MNEGKFIAHTGSASQPSRVPRQGLGLFSVLAFVIAILSGAATGGLVFLESTYKTRVDDSLQRLEEIKEKTEIGSLLKVLDVQNRIELASTLLAGHVYPSQAFNFVEDNTLDLVSIQDFGYSDQVINLKLSSPTYLVFAQQIKHLRRQEAIEMFEFSPPTLTDTGDVVVSLKITLKEDFIRQQPAPYSP
jgi:hypothetical protein